MQQLGGTGTASGVVYVFMPSSIDPIGNCPVYQYTATGSYNPSQLVDGQEGSTAFTWTASNPSPNTPCNGYVPVSSMTFTGTMINKSTDSGNGTWTNSSGLSGSFVFEADPNIIPTGETVQAGGWNSALPTEANFIQVLTDSRSYDPDPNQNLFQGRQVWETTASPGTDGCYQAAQAAGLVYPGPPFTSVTGGVWSVGYSAGYSGNAWGYDTIGGPPNGVSWYR